MSSRTSESLVTHRSGFHWEDCPSVRYLDSTCYVSVRAPSNYKILLRAWYCPVENLWNHLSKAEIISKKHTCQFMSLCGCLAFRFLRGRGVHYPKGTKNTWRDPATYISLCLHSHNAHNNIEVCHWIKQNNVGAAQYHVLGVRLAQLVAEQNMPLKGTM